MTKTYICNRMQEIWDNAEEEERGFSAEDMELLKKLNIELDRIRSTENL